MNIFMSIFVLSLLFFNLAQADDEGGDLGTLVVQASRSNDTVGQMNKDVTVITSQEIAKSPAKSLPELLNEVPGVDARVNTNAHDEQVNMGGFGEQNAPNVLILVDGRRLNTPDLAGANLSLINLNSIDHIEVIQGAATVLYGDSANGGVINIVTKKGMENTKPSVTLTSEIDSYKGNKDGIDVGGGISHLTYQFDYDRDQSNNYRTYNNFWSNDFDSRMDYDPTDIFGVDFSQGYHLDRFKLPGALSIAQINSLGTTGAVVSREYYGTDSDSHFDVTPHVKFDEGESHFDFSLFTSSRKSDINFVNAASSNGFATNYELESYEFQPKIIITTPLTDRLDNKLTSGYDYIYYTENRRFNSPNTLQDQVYATEASQGVYLLDEVTMDEHWLLNAGARGAWANYVFDQTQQTPLKFDRSTTTEGFDGGLGYKYNPDSKIFVNYTRSYRLPVLDEFFESPFPGQTGGDTQATLNQGLTYQVGNQYQLGVRDHSFKDVNMGLTATEVQYKNEIYDDPNLNGGTDANYNGRTRHISEEGDVSVDLFNKRLRPFANITFQQTNFVSGDFSGKRVPDVPQQLAHAGITFMPLTGLSTTIQDDFVGNRYGLGDDANLFPQVKRYNTLDWSVKYDYKNYELWFSLNDMLDRRYFVYGSSYGLVGGYAPEVYYPAPGRNVQVGVKVKF